MVTQILFLLFFSLIHCFIFSGTGINLAYKLHSPIIAVNCLLSKNILHERSPQYKNQRGLIIISRPGNDICSKRFTTQASKSVAMPMQCIAGAPFAQCSRSLAKTMPLLGSRVIKFISVMQSPVVCSGTPVL